jgi:Putative auto-transporter adhesin, head GIN domain
MKKILLSLLVVVITTPFINAQKVINDANAEKRPVSGFHGINVATGIELILTAGSTEEVAVSAATNEFRDKIITRVESGVLKIYYETKTGAINKRKETKDLKAYVSYKSLDILHVSTGAELTINGVLKSTKLDMTVNTGALVSGEVDITTLQVDQSTGSKVTLSGKVSTLNVEGSTGSKFKGEDMATSNCSVTVSTGAIVTVSAEKELQVKASTGGNVKYKGTPSIREVKTSSGGSVSKI